MSSGTAFDLGVALGDYTGVPVVECPGLQAGIILCGDRMILVRNQWDEIQLPLMIGAMRQEMRAHLADLVAAVEQRLGLDRP